MLLKNVIYCIFLQIKEDNLKKLIVLRGKIDKDISDAELYKKLILY